MFEKLLAKRHIQNLDLSSVRANAMAKLGWSSEKAQRVENSYKRFLYALAHKEENDFFLRHPRKWTTSGTSTFSTRASIARIATRSLATTSTTHRGFRRKTNAEQMRAGNRFIAITTLMRSHLPRPIRGGLMTMMAGLMVVLPAAVGAAATVPAIMPTDTIP